MPADHPLRLVQVTDSHLCHPPGDIKHSGRNTDLSLKAVLQAVRERETALDLVLATGDLAEDPSTAVYTRLREYFATLPVATLCLPGNHDNPALMAEHLDSACGERLLCRDLGCWRIILLDSTMPEQTSGCLSTGGLAALERRLAEAPDRHIMIGLHHHPVPIGQAHMDSLMLANPDALLALLERYPQVRGLLWGHIHRAFHAYRNGRHLLGGPATSIQLAWENERTLVADLPPAYRRVFLWPDGRLDSDVVYVETVATAKANETNETNVSFT